MSRWGRCFKKLVWSLFSKIYKNSQHAGSPNCGIVEPDDWIYQRRILPKQSNEELLISHTCRCCLKKNTVKKVSGFPVPNWNVTYQGEFGKWHPGCGRESRYTFFPVYSQFFAGQQIKVGCYTCLFPLLVFLIPVAGSILPVLAKKWNGMYIFVK